MKGKMVVKKETIEREGKEVLRYHVKEGYGDVAYFDNLYTAGVVCRFIKGSQLNKAEYDAAISAMKEWDEAHSIFIPEGIS